MLFPHVGRLEVDEAVSKKKGIVTHNSPTFASLAPVVTAIKAEKMAKRTRFISY